jgi:hypothetical protein
VSFAYTTLRTETPATNYTRTFRYYNCSTGGVILNVLTTVLSQGRTLRAQDIELFIASAQGNQFSGSFVTLLTEDTNGGLQRVVRAVARSPATGVLIHDATTQTLTIQGVTTTRVIRENCYYIPLATLSGTDIIAGPPP